jgi:aminoglycoside 6'-N-acetyltransferase I
MTLPHSLPPSLREVPPMSHRCDATEQAAEGACLGNTIRQIKDILQADIPACAALFIDAYNREPWNNCWTADSAARYLLEFLHAQRFKGFLIEEGNRALGAAFCHSHIWYTGDELHIDEFFIASGMQRKGLGSKMMAAIELYVKAEGMESITLLTDRHFPARDFYLKHGFQEAEQVLFMYKDV